jgi:hypothetical protein
MKSALTVEDDPTGPPRTEVTKAEGAPALAATTPDTGEDEAVEIAAAQRESAAPPDPDVTPAPEPVAAEKR